MNPMLMMEMPDLDPDGFKPQLGRMRLFKGGGGAPAPDPQIGKAAIMQAELGQEALDWYQEQYANYIRPRQDRIDAQNQSVVDQQMRIADANEARAGESYDNYLKTYRPLENKMVDDAMNYDSAERKSQQAGIAATDVDFAFNNAQQQQARNQARMGVNPNSGRSQAMATMSTNAQALAKSGAMTKARNDVTDRAISLRAGAANFGRGMQNTASNAYGIALSGGAGAAGIAQANQAAAIAGQSGIQNGFNTAMQGYSNQANILNTQYQNQLTAWQQNQASKNDLLGSIAGAAGMYFGATSSKKTKTNKRAIDTEKVADQLKTMPVENWQYKKGIEDEGQHTGPYAEDFAKRFGGRTDSIDLISANGVNMAATQGVMKKLDKLESKVEKLSKKG